MYFPVTSLVTKPLQTLIFSPSYNISVNHVDSLNYFCTHTVHTISEESFVYKVGGNKLRK